MRAVNLIPVDRRRSSGGIGRSGGAVYVILGALGGLLILATLYAVANHQVADRKAQLVKDTQESASATARASQLAPYKQFSDLRNQNEQSVVSLASARFDWPTLMRNIASSLPPGVVLSTFEGTPPGTSTGAPTPAPAAGAAGSGGGPSVHMVGCATSHTQVGDVINRLRGVPGVLTVAFSSSTKASSGGTGPAPAGASAGSGACGPGGPQFDLTVSVSASGATPSSSSATATSSTQTGAAGAVAPATGTPAPAVGSHP